MKSNLLVLALSLSTVAALVGPPVATTHAAPAPQSIGQDDSGNGDQGHPGKGNANGKGKGKAKGHYKNHQDSTEQSAPAVSSTTASGKPATETPASASAASAPSAAPAPAKSQPAVSSAPAASPKEQKAELDKRVRRVNTLDNNATAAKAGLEAISKETGVPVTTLQTQVKQYKVGSAGLLMANEMAKATGKPANTFLKQRMQQNREWDRIAADNKFDLSTVFPNFDRVQASMEGVQKTGKR